MYTAAERKPESNRVERWYPGRYISCFGLLLAVLAFFQLAAFGQVATGSLSGTVYDSTGAIIPNAQVVMKNDQSGDLRKTFSNGQGFFTITAVQPGSYSVTVSSNGFNSWRQNGITFSQGDNRSLPNISLQVGGATQAIEVVADSESIAPVETGENSQTLNTYMITEISIQGRDAAELIKIMPGVALNTGLGQNGGFSSLVTGTNNGPIGSYSINGTQPNGGVSMTVEGANVVDSGNQGTQIANVNQDHTQEIKILTSAFGAEYAKGPVTFQAYGKSGGSAFHGGGYLYARNGIFNSVDAFQKSQGALPVDEKYFYPGVTIGGPVIIPGTGFNKNHDKLFFWAGYEYMNQHPVGSLGQHVVPTADMLNGDFSPASIAKLGPLFASNFPKSAITPCGNAQAGCGTLDIVNGVIPKSQLDPNMLAIAKLFPAPNIDPQSHGGYNYQFSDNSPQNRWELKTRVDWNISDRTKVYVSVGKQDQTAHLATTLWWAPTQALPYPSPLVAATVANNYSANITHVFTPTLTNETVFAYARYINPATLANPDAVKPATIGYNVKSLFAGNSAQFPFVQSWSGGNGFPGFYSQAVFGGTFNGGAFGGLKRAPSVSDNLTKVWGTHTVKTGFYWDYAGNEQSENTPTNGALFFEDYGATTTGNVIADLLTGHGQSYNEASAGPVNNMKYYQYSFFLQDQWKATRKLTLTYGLRFDHLGQWYKVDGPGLAVWDPASYDNTANAPALTGLKWNAIDPTVPKSGFVSPTFYYNPRFGVAYDLFGHGNTVLRGGFGVYRYQFANNDVGGAVDAPLKIINFNTPAFAGTAQIPTFTPSSGNGLGGGINALMKGDDRVPRTMNYNFIISQRTPWNSVMEFVYTGNKSDNQLRTGNGDAALGNINRIPLGAFFQPNPVTGVVVTSGWNNQDYRPLHNYQGIGVVSHGGYANYNAFQLLWQKQSGPVHVTANYTFSKVLGTRDGQTNNGGGNGNLIDSFNIDNNYGVLAYDHTHIINGAYVFNLPKPIHDNKLVGGVVNGWELSGITQWQSGAPIQPNTGGNLNVQFPGNDTTPGALYPNGVSNGTILGTNAITLVPVLTCDPRSGLKSGQYFNPSCFTTPTYGHNGSVIWPYIKGPAYWNSDLALYKNFKMTENQNIQLRFSAFNFLNHALPQFNTSGNNDIKLNFATAGGPNVNTQTTGTPLHSVGRRVIELTIKYNF